MPLPDINQIVDPQSVARMATDRIEATTVVRDFYMDPPGGIPEGAGESYEVPVPAEELGLPEEVEPGTDVTYDREEYGRPEISRQIFKKGSKIAEEDINDNIFDLVEDHMDGHAKNMAKKLDLAAFSVLDAAAPAGSAVGDDDGDVTFSDVYAGVTELANRGEDGFTADMALFGPGAKEGIVTNLAERGTDLGDEAIETGQFGSYAGLDLMYTNNVPIGANDVIVVDSSEFGFEGEWQPVTTDQTTDFDSDSVKVKIKSAYGWAPKRSEAAVRVQG